MRSSFSPRCQEEEEEEVVDLLPTLLTLLHLKTSLVSHQRSANATLARRQGTTAFLHYCTLSFTPFTFTPLNFTLVSFTFTPFTLTLTARLITLTHALHRTGATGE